jgi:hypothetical protein
MRSQHQFSMEYTMLQATRALLDRSLAHRQLGRPEETLCSTKATHHDPPQYYSSRDHAKPSPPSLTQEDTTMECESPLHHNENDQTFPIIEWSDKPSFASIDARGSQSRVSCSTEDYVNEDISCRLHSLSLDHRTLHRSMAFMENLSSLDGSYSGRN